MPTIEKTLTQQTVTQIEGDIIRLGKKVKALHDKEPAIAQLYGELSGTILSYLRDLAHFASQGESKLLKLEQNTVEVMDEFHERLGALEDDSGTQFTPEHAEKFSFVVQGALQLVELALGNPAIDATEKAMLTKLKQAGTECMDIIEQSTVGVDEEVDEGDEEGDEGEGDEGEEDAEVNET